MQYFLPRVIYFLLFAFLPLAGQTETAKSTQRTGSQLARAHLLPSYRLSRSDTRLKLAPALRGVPAGRASVDTLRLLAIRVEFQPDTIRQTTGDGLFLRTADAQYTLDPPPHLRAYFQAQLQALANYYRSVSNGHLILQPQVYPQQEDAAYRLDRPMNYYGPGRNHPESDNRLSELLHDGILKAEAEAAIDFSQFDSFILFHAGVGEDFNEDFDQTPNDVPSAFLTLDDLRQALGNNDPNYQGIAVQNGTFFITDGIILPETQSREIAGAGLVEFGLLGTTALMFGHQIGLPNLFNTDNGASGVGQFGLMDQGSNNYQGLLPAQPCAWSKVFLGWEEPMVLTQGNNLAIAAALHQNPNKTYKIPITDTEYFLLENRQRDVNGDRIAIGRDVNGTRIEFKETSFLANQTIGVITSVDEYDFGLPYAVDENGRVLPGCGIFIWHIDEKVIRENYASNRVNANPDRRGVDLEEADGAQDIGRFYGFLDPGSGSELGVAEDAWWKSNPVIFEYLRPDEDVTFGPATIPSTASNAGQNTGIVISNFSEIGAVMTFSVSNEFSVPGFPKFITGKTNVLSPMLADLTGDGVQEIVVATTSGEIHAWQFNGEKVIANDDAVTVTAPNGLVSTVPVARFAVVGDSLYSPPALVDLNGDGGSEVIAAGKNGKLQAWQARDTNADGRADLLWEYALPGAVRANLVAAPDRRAIYCGTVDGRLVAVSNTGTQLWEFAAGGAVQGLSLTDQANLLVATSGALKLIARDGSAELGSKPEPAGIAGAPAVANLLNDIDYEVAYFTGDGELRLLNASLLELEGFQEINAAFSSQSPALADFDGDGRKEIIAAAENRVLAVYFNGVLAQNFPQQISLTVNAKAQQKISPIVLDADGDGAQDILIPGVDGNVYAYRSDGRPIEGFPLAMNGPGIGSLATGDIDRDGKLELIGVSGNGYLQAWRLPRSQGDPAWPMLYHDALHSNLNAARETPVVAQGALMPLELVYNYPNPTAGGSTRIRYRLNAAARVKISIYDTAGDLVTELSGAGVAQADNEVEWLLNGVQSGIYLARVEAEGETERAVKIIKIAVVK